MAYGDSFTTALATSRRRAQLAGRPLSQQETAGIAAGYADTASDRAARVRALELQRQSQEEIARANAANEAERSRAALESEKIAREQIAQRRKEAEEAARQQQTSSRVTGTIVGGYAGSLLSIGGSTGNPYATAAGAILGYASNNWSYFCTAAHNLFPDKITASDLKTLGTVMEYAKREHPAWVKFYDDYAPMTITILNTYGLLKGAVSEIVIPAVHETLILIEYGSLARAFNAYKNTIVPLIVMCIPEAKEAADKIKGAE